MRNATSLRFARQRNRVEMALMTNPEEAVRIRGPQMAERKYAEAVG
jgi:hypothetical protein